MIHRGRTWGAKQPFRDYLRHIKDPEEYAFILEWIIKEYILDERELVTQKHYTPSEFFDYYFDLLVSNPKQDIIKEILNKPNITKYFEEDLNYEKQLCLYGYDYLTDDLKRKTKYYFENNYTLLIDPYFIKKFKSETLKNTIFKIISDDNPLSYSSNKYPITKYIRFLHHEKMLNENDKKLICEIIQNKYKLIISHKDFFNYGFVTLKDTIADLYFCLENILTVKERQTNIEINDTYEIIRNEFLNQIKNIYYFEWLYTNDYQKFRISFSNVVSYFSYLHQAKDYLYIFNIVLSKLIVEDNSNFEAVLELFVTIYSNKYENNVLMNNETHILFIQLMKKYKIEIPYCYDYLFIKKQMKLIAEALRKNKINDEIIDFWLTD